VLGASSELLQNIRIIYTNIKQFQLCLGDYLKVNKAAAEIAALATDLLGWLNNHGKVRKVFDNAQKQISEDRTGQAVILAYLIANLTRWTTHYVAFVRLHRVKDALQFSVLKSRRAIVAAQVGAAKYTEKAELTENAEHHCNVIGDHTFWLGLETLIGDIEPITLGTNINQADSTRPDQVLLTIAGIYLHFVDHPEPLVAKAMSDRIEKRWKACDQPLFILALILNPFEGLSAFGSSANLNNFKCNTLLVYVCSLCDVQL
jgi:hypothetical protein